jgi:ABC-type sugar transport system ATPase subunit
MENPVLTMKGIEKQFVGVKAVDNVDLELFEGEILAIVGENGAGKSTLMKILSGSYPAASYKGEIKIGGKPVHFDSTKDSETAGIEMIYQEISLHLDLSVSENIFLGNLPVKRSGFVDWQRMKVDGSNFGKNIGEKTGWNQFKVSACFFYNLNLNSKGCYYGFKKRDRKKSNRV